MDLQEFRYLRLGFIDDGSFSSKCAKWAFENIPCRRVMPRRWGYLNRDSFLKRFGGGVIWGQNTCYQLLIVEGTLLCRFWTISPTACRIQWLTTNERVSFKEKDGIEPFQEYVIKHIKEPYGI